MLKDALITYTADVSLASEYHKQNPAAANINVLATRHFIRNKLYLAANAGNVSGSSCTANGVTRYSECKAVRPIIP